MRRVHLHLQTYIVRGIFAAVPLILSGIALWLLYYFIDKRVTAPIESYFHLAHIPGLGIVLLLFALLLIGIITSNVVGQQLWQVVEFFTSRIPLVKQIYGLSKEVADVLVGEHSQHVFKKTILINYPNASQWTVGFLAGRMHDPVTGEDWLKVYIPMAHPAIGFVYFAKDKSVLDPGWSAEEGLKMVVTLGLVVPKGGLA
jgi:uncharacterized membrane protein